MQLAFTHGTFLLGEAESDPSAFQPTGMISIHGSHRIANDLSNLTSRRRERVKPVVFTGFADLDRAINSYRVVSIR
jgi:hypothetical protein